MKLIQIIENKFLIDFLKYFFNPNNTSLVQKLLRFISNSNNEKKICKAYEYLGKIGEKKCLPELTNLLIERYFLEKNDKIRSSIFRAILWHKKDKNTNLKPIIDVIKQDKDFGLLNNLIELLQNSTNPEAEDTLIYVIEKPFSDWTVLMAIVTLHTSGTRKCINSLKTLLNHSDKDVAGAALIAIIKHCDFRESNLLIEQLNSGKNRDTAMEGVVKHCKEEAVEHIIKRIKTRTSRVRNMACSTYFYEYEESEITIGLKFLNKYKSINNNIDIFYDFLLEKRKDKLLDFELKVLLDLINTPHHIETLKLRKLD
jgi:HEAT repeat protein